MNHTSSFKEVLLQALKRRVPEDLDFLAGSPVLFQKPPFNETEEVRALSGQRLIFLFNLDEVVRFSASRDLIFEFANRGQIIFKNFHFYRHTEVMLNEGVILDFTEFLQMLEAQKGLQLDQEPLKDFYGTNTSRGGPDLQDLFAPFESTKIQTSAATVYAARAPLKAFYLKKGRDDLEKSNDNTISREASFYDSLWVKQQLSRQYRRAYKHLRPLSVKGATSKQKRLAVGSSTICLAGRQRLAKMVRVRAEIKISQGCSRRSLLVLPRMTVQGAFSPLDWVVDIFTYDFHLSKRIGQCFRASASPFDWKWLAQPSENIHIY